MVKSPKIFIIEQLSSFLFSDHLFLINNNKILTRHLSCNKSLEVTTPLINNWWRAIAPMYCVWNIVHKACTIVQGSVLAWQKSHTQYLNSTPPAILLWGTLLLITEWSGYIPHQGPPPTGAFLFPLRGQQQFHNVKSINIRDKSFYTDQNILKRPFAFSTRRLFKEPKDYCSSF